MNQLDEQPTTFEPANDEARQALDREWESGRLAPFGERLLAFVERHRDAIQREAGADADAHALLLAAKHQVTHAGAVHPRSEMRDQAREISDEIWIRGEHGDYDRAHIAEEWTSRHAADWRHWRLTEYLYVMDRLSDEIVARLGG
ncbi:MAG: hypothetical protein U0164_06795 [Gemmatimonadaceae bacterium]